MSFGDEVGKFRDSARRAEQARQVHLRAEKEAAETLGASAVAFRRRAAEYVAEARNHLRGTSVPTSRLYYHHGRGVFGGYRFLPQRAWPLASLALTDERAPRLIPRGARPPGARVTDPGRRFRDHILVVGPRVQEVWAGALLDWRYDDPLGRSARVTASSVRWDRDAHRSAPPGVPLIHAGTVAGGWEESNLHVHVSLRDWLAAEVAVLEQRAGAQ